MILFLLGIEGGHKDYVGVTIVGGQYVFITTAVSGRKSHSVVCVELGDMFVPNVHFV